jgi:hypothetical protein
MSLVRLSKGPGTRKAAGCGGGPVLRLGRYGQVARSGAPHRASRATGMPHSREGIMAPTSPAVRVRIMVIRTPQIGFAGANRSRGCAGLSIGGVEACLSAECGGNQTSRTVSDEEVRAMPQKAWSAKRERQYEHIKEGLQDRGRSEDTAEEIAARTVNKERARSGEAKERSRTSVEDISSGRRGGLRSHSGSQGRTRDQLYEEAKDLNIEGRSRMNKQQLLRAVNRRTNRSGS